MRKVSRYLLILAMTFTVFSSAALACGPEFEEAYLVRGAEEDFFAVPEGNFLSELEHIANKNKKEVESRGYEGSANADIHDLEEALGKLGRFWWQRRSAIKSYSEVREELARFIKENPISDEWNWWAGPFGRKAIGRLEKKFSLGGNFKFNKYIPEEFCLYLKGAIAYHNNDTELAIELWKQLLALRPAERRFKSVWASFMIGKAYLSLGMAKESIPYFEQTRKLESEGYKDTLNLSVDSISWQARAEYEIGEIIASMHHYFEVLDSVSLSWVCGSLAEDEDIVFQDNLCRRIFLGWLVSRDRLSDGKSMLPQYLEVIRKVGSGIDHEDADRVAWILYNKGDFTGAKEWLSGAGEKTALGRWLWTKLMLREGNNSAAVKELQELLPFLDKNEEWNKRFSVEEKKAYLCMGMLELNRKDYLSAFRILCQGAYWEDVAYVAEKVLTPDELENALSPNERKLSERTLKDADSFSLHHLSHSFNDESFYSALRYLLARRYARLGDWNKAVEYMPEIVRISSGYFDGTDQYDVVHLKQLASEMKKLLDQAGDEALRARKRAKCYYEAAIMMRKYGMELSGTELDPDWFDYGGDYDQDSSMEQRFGILTGAREGRYGEEWNKEAKDKLLSKRARMEKERQFFDGSEDEEKRVLVSLPDPMKRYHYRYRAAELMWKSAELLPVNDKLKAKALCVGGTFIKVRDPQYALKFYNELVATCPDTKLGREAVKLKWFPKIKY